MAGAFGQRRLAGLAFPRLGRSAIRRRRLGVRLPVRGVHTVAGPCFPLADVSPPALPTVASSSGSGSRSLSPSASCPSALFPPDVTLGTVTWCQPVIGPESARGRAPGAP
eukprot:4432824-Pyramimonas_sp.AAC.1